MKFKIQERAWIGFMPLPDGEAIPAFISSIKPLKTGSGLLELNVTEACYAPKSVLLTIQVQLHREDFLIGQAQDGVHAGQTLMLSNCSENWLQRYCPLARQLLTSHAQLDDVFGRLLKGVASEYKDPAWKKPMPLQSESIHIGREYAQMEGFLVSAGLIPEQMEDKWLICLEDNTLRFYRSWTGICVYEAQMVPRNGRMYLDYCRINRDLDQHTGGSAADEADQVLTFIERLLIRR